METKSIIMRFFYQGLSPLFCVIYSPFLPTYIIPLPPSLLSSLPPTLPLRGASPGTCCHGTTLLRDGSVTE